MFGELAKPGETELNWTVSMLATIPEVVGSASIKVDSAECTSLCLI